jgi:hypothetical protein
MHNSEEDMEHVLDDFWRHNLFLIAFVTEAPRIETVGDKERGEVYICALALFWYLRC